MACRRTQSLEDLRWEVEAREQALVLAAVRANDYVSHPDNTLGMPQAIKGS